MENTIEYAMIQAHMYEVAEKNGFDVRDTGDVYEIRFANRPDMRPLRLTNLVDVLNTVTIEG